MTQESAQPKFKPKRTSFKPERAMDLGGLDLSQKGPGIEGARLKTERAMEIEVNHIYPILVVLGFFAGSIFRHGLILRLTLTMYSIHLCIGIGLDTDT